MKKLPVEKKSQVRNSVLRVLLFLVAALLQLIWLLSFFGSLKDKSVELSTLLEIVSIVMALWIYGKDQNTTKQIPWMLLLLIFPIGGIVLYVVFGRNSLLNKTRKKFAALEEEIYPYLKQDLEVLDQLEKFSPSLAGSAYATYRSSGYPIYINSNITYYSDALDGLEAQMKEMENAKHFIFMEYHAIEDKEAFARMKEILIRKASQGVDVRLFYDDMGSAAFVNYDFMKQMKQAGIQCRIFNPIMPLLLVFMNNRDHRKITVIDGKVGFTGGYNLANEYFHITHPYGFWKDSGVRITGKAVNALTLTFLGMWNSVERSDPDFSVYLKARDEKGKGFIQPYADSPLDNQYVGENVYMNIVNASNDYVYFCTPYLIISDEMKRALQLAASRGVDVRIITPGIPDKKLTYQITRSYYNDLVRHGIQIYEYTPGFCHAKMCISDGKVATVGTINLDYRSLYLNFENGVYIVDHPIIQEIHSDFDEMFRVSRNVTQAYLKELSVLVRTWKAVLRLVSPLF